MAEENQVVEGVCRPKAQRQRAGSREFDIALEGSASKGSANEEKLQQQESDDTGSQRLTLEVSAGAKRKRDTTAAPLGSASLHSPGQSAPSSPSPCATPGSSPVKAGGRMLPPAAVTPGVGCGAWIRLIVAPLPAEPGPDLQTCFKACEREDIAAEIASRVKAVTAAIFRQIAEQWSSESLGDEKSWVEARRLEAVKLYYRVLGAMCRAEVQRLRSNNAVTPLLINERFQRCVLVCASEIVLAAHHCTIAFQDVIATVGVTAFDVGKVIESFIRCEETIPGELKRHLNACEERILESLSWERGSSLYSTLATVRKNMMSEILRLDLMPGPLPPLSDITAGTPLATLNGGLPTQRSAHGSTPAASPSASPRRTLLSAAPTSPIHTNGASMPAGENGGSLSFRSPAKDRVSAFSIFMSPVKRDNSSYPHLQAAFASPQRPSPSGGGETCAELQFSVFTRKVLKLAAIRIRALGERLHQSSAILEQVYRVVSHALQQETTLFFNRHLDQIILSSIYGVCKVSHVNMTFKDIISQYRKLPLVKAHVFRNVFIDVRANSDGKATATDTGDIIRFYNEVFVPATKAFLLQLSPAHAPEPSSPPRQLPNIKDDPASSPMCSPFSSLPQVSPKRVSVSHNVYVSPLRSSMAESLLSPKTRQLYACLGESVTPYQSPSKNLEAINNRICATRGACDRRLGRLDFTDAASDADAADTPSRHGSGGSPPRQELRMHLTVHSALSPSRAHSWNSISPVRSPVKRPRLDR